MAKWMDKEFMNSLSNKIKKGLTKDFLELANEYQNLKIENLSDYIKKVYNFYPKASKSDALMIGMLDPMIGYTYENAENLEAKDREEYEKSYFDRIKVAAALPPDVELKGILAIGFTPMCVSNFKKGYELDDTKEENSEEEVGDDTVATTFPSIGNEIGKVTEPTATDSTTTSGDENGDE